MLRSGQRGLPAPVRTHWIDFDFDFEVDERDSFSAIDAHIFPCLVQTVLEDVD